MESKIWFPDTCGCGMAIMIDGNQITPLENGFSKALNTEIPIYCAAHTGLNYQEQYDTVLEENNRKNILIKGVAVNVPGTSENIVDEGGNVIEVALKESVSIKYHFDESRALVIDGTEGVTAETAQEVKTYVLGLGDPKITHV